MKKLVFYKCEICGNVVIKLVDKHVPVFCCGKVMNEITQNTQEAATEKHIPVVEIKDNEVKVKVGSVEHPMNEEHYISHIILKTEKGFCVRELSPSDKPETTFIMSPDDKVECVYSLCNLHGLWQN